VEVLLSILMEGVAMNHHQDSVLSFGVIMAGEAAIAAVLGWRVLAVR